jgi:hypothetical protein
VKQFILFRRLMWWSPAQLTCWWLPRIFRGTDEYCNPSIAAVIPPLGAFILFWKPGPLRTKPCEECAAMDEVEVFELSAEEWEAAKNRALASIGLTYEELEQQAKSGVFESFKHRKVWHVVREV